MKYIVASFTSISPVAECGHLSARDIVNLTRQWRSECKFRICELGAQPAPYVPGDLVQAFGSSWSSQWFKMVVCIVPGMWISFGLPEAFGFQVCKTKKNSEVSGFASLGGEAPPYNARGQAVKLILIGASSTCIGIPWHTYLIDMYSQL